MSKKSGKIAALIAGCEGTGHDPHFAGYVKCFNDRLFYESHDVLEELWLQDRHGPNGSFYKGLIQFAGAFVHLQKDRLRPSAALFKLALANLEKYPARHDGLDLAFVLQTIRLWLDKLETGRFSQNPLTNGAAPELALDARPAAGSALPSDRV